MTLTQFSKKWIVINDAEIILPNLFANSSIKTHFEKIICTTNYVFTIFAFFFIFK
jgi:hypothetical protein